MEWHGYCLKEFEFEGRLARLVCPKGEAVGKLLLKTEYWGAFPDVELGMLERGYHLCYLKNQTRFATREDCDAKARFVRFLAKEYGLSERCIPIGMSCGGAHAVRFAGFYPELVSCMFIDAPVLNYFDFPGKVGDPTKEKVWEREFVYAYPDIKRHRLAGFTEHPICMADTLIENKIPVIMVYGTSDDLVLYEENGALLEQAFEGSGLLKVIRVSNRGHHPHGKIGDNTEIIEFLTEHSR